MHRRAWTTASSAYAAAPSPTDLVERQFTATRPNNSRPSPISSAVGDRHDSRLSCSEIGSRTSCETLLRARSISLRDEPGPPGPHVMCFDVPAGAAHHRGRIEAVFEPSRRLDGWTCQLRESAAHVAALILEIERASGRMSSSARGRPDGTAPLIGSSPAIRAVRERIERVAAPDFTVLIEGASGPQLHPSFILGLFSGCPRSKREGGGASGGGSVSGEGLTLPPFRAIRRPPLRSVDAVAHAPGA
jgi:hypothetical protein